ncbi:NRAMP family divalent metal transporter [Streptomonospora wellingtoniae]|uniref:Divalent metal cation transporter n=1 Tax=Streptomonospora wellingtoniae TaxID=3075544 RepID=A0ABU2KW32_9ACTN|nr:divalent metal cation transporter [Streptomonospora sp. DSM 45055]MDT0303511.1 divalent metal cation transporter [Streptomonospora sp. DSM 45055]
MSETPEVAPKPPRTRRVLLNSGLLGAMFLMATSAIGPGFITQTTEFTARLGAAFAFAILVSVLVDIAVQLNIWRVIGVAEMRAQDLANKVLPGAGYVLAALVVFGGIVFNVGNIAGTALGLDALAGVDMKLGGALSAAVAVALFVLRGAGVALDRILVALGVLMIGLTLYVTFVSRPPVGDALRHAVLPGEVTGDLFLATVTIIGGTVGGYITYAGAHRLVDNGLGGIRNVGAVTQTSVVGIVVTGVMRVLLFLAVLGVVTGGAAILDSPNAPAAAFAAAAGETGRRLFGLIMWAAAISSVIGASYTSVSFISTFSAGMARNRNWLVAGFIALCTVLYLGLGQAPATLLILAGSLNGLILPVGLGIMLWVAARRRADLLHGYRYPVWLLGLGVLAWLVTVYIAANALGGIADLWQ